MRDIIIHTLAQCDLSACVKTTCVLAWQQERRWCFIVFILLGASLLHIPHPHKAMALEVDQQLAHVALSEFVSVHTHIKSIY